ncbi:hypothetical protein FNF28_06448 [Cafeteria roenbergensis]|uniref:Enkurin domain-containing protein n=1 Tax=Cafeteria roenbergensis TaxID=33653 RepID=A0A5A8D1V1_CAFRO|nr:hypothetical protein FNF28_06448 [Cafeteria roenbergensis]
MAAAAGAESIYNWIKEEAEAPTKARMHRSRFNPKAPPAYSTLRVAKKATGAIGKSVKDTINPRKFLKAGSRMGKGVTPATSQARKFTRRAPPDGGKAPVPKRTERPIHGITSSKNFVVANAVENILAAPPEPEVAPDYLHKEDFGRVPEYLEELGDDEREELLDALKAKWDVVNARYQKMTHLKISTHNSSLGQIRNKEQCEAQMDELERDIARLSVKGPIYVVDE